jgi:hypothetical protein
MNTTENPDDDPVAELRPIERIKLAVLMFQLANYNGPPGSHMRDHRKRLDKLLKAADKHAAKVRRLRVATHRDDEPDE